MADIEEVCAHRRAALEAEPLLRSSRTDHARVLAGVPFRRLFDRLDLTDTLELACGHGRHSEHIAGRCGRLVLMDIHQENIEFCGRRLARFQNVEHYLDNGFDFQPAPANSFTALFCYDAMVHFSPDIVRSYVLDTARVLKAGGKALYHHSNYPAPPDRHYGQNPHARNHMTQQLFRQYCVEAGLVFEEAIVMPWGHDADLDCLSLLRKP